MEAKPPYNKSGNHFLFCFFLYIRFKKFISDVLLQVGIDTTGG